MILTEWCNIALLVLNLFIYAERLCIDSRLKTLQNMQNKSISHIRFVYILFPKLSITSIVCLHNEFLNEFPIQHVCEFQLIKSDFR